MKLVKTALALAINASFLPFYSIAESVQTTDASDIEVISVVSSFKPQPLAQVPTSIAIVDQQKITDQSMQHFEELINSVANLNFSGESSRPKYIQIRGVGERSEYQGAPNSSVGFIVDDIDLSGLGMAASMYDVQQVEVLRGPQGTRFGANALAGLVYIKSNDPTSSPEHGLRVTVGDDDLISTAGYSSGAITDKLTYRVSVEKHDQDGYRDNDFLDKDDTNGIDELTGKIKLRYQAADDLRFDFTYIFADLDNGYDVWTLDNNGFDTLTDKPGESDQDSKGSSVKVTYDGLSIGQLTSITSYTSTDYDQSYDGDWANPEFWAERSCDAYDDDWNVIGKEPCVYDYIWDKQAERDVFTQEFRLSSNETSRIFADSTDWTLGLYYSDLDENNDLESYYNGWEDEILQSDYEADSFALFTQLDVHLPNDFELSVGLRGERRETDYSDSAGENFSPSENMWGGHIALSKQLNDEHNAYARISRGYKAGGFNMGLPAELSKYKEYDTETLVNYEIGMQSSFLENSLTSRLAVFYMDRSDQQVNASQQNPENPQRFIIYTSNAAASDTYGAEIELNWYAMDNLDVYATAGYLDASYDDYSYRDKYGSEIDISGREIAHAPNYTYSVGSTYRDASGLFANINMSGKDGFYFSDSHNEKSNSSRLINAKIGYEFSQLSVYIWGRNLTDEKVATRGFYFGNEPDIDWEAKTYVKYGAPKQLGITLDYEF